MRKDVFDVLLQKHGTIRNLFNKEWFIKSLPNVTFGASMDSRQVIVPDVDVDEMTFTDFERLEFYRELRNGILPESYT